MGTNKHLPNGELKLRHNLIFIDKFSYHHEMVFIRKNFSIQTGNECCDDNAKHIELLDLEIENLTQDSLTSDMIGSETIGISDDGMLNVIPASIGAAQLSPSIIEALEKISFRLQELGETVESINKRVDSTQNSVNEIEDEVSMLTKTVSSTADSVTLLSDTLGIVQEDIAEISLKID